MKKAALFALLVLSTTLVCTDSFAIRWENGRLTTDYSVDFYYENVYGNVDRSALDVNRTTKDNWQYNERLKVQLEQKITDDTNLEFFFYGRHITDQQIQNDRAKILQMYLRLYSDNYEFAVGDVSEYYTKYTFNNTFIGVRAWVKPNEMVKLMLLGGRNREGSSDTFEHTFGGGRIEFTPRPNYLFGATYLHAEVTKLFPGTSVLDYSSDILSFDTSLKLLNRKLLIKGETAFSWYVRDRNDPLTDKPEGWALDLQIDYRPVRALKLSLDYEYVEPNFITIMGSAARDRETIKGEVRYIPRDELEIWGKYRFTGNRLSESSEALYRTDTHYAETGIIYKPFYDSSTGHFKNLRIDLRFDYMRRISNDTPLSVDDERFNTRLFISNAINSMRYSLEYDFRYTNDFVFSAPDTMTNTIGAKWGYSFPGLGLLWGLDLGCKVDFRKTYVPNYAFDDTIASISAGFAVSHPSSRTTFQGNYLGVFSDLDNGYDTVKHSFEVSLDHVLYQNETLTSIVSLSYKNLDFRSENKEDTYGENIYMLSLTLRF